MDETHERTDNTWSLLRFDTMLMPKIITGIYWLSLAGILVSAVGIIFQGAFLYGLGVFVFGIFMARLWCEFVIVIFKINENIQKIADKS